MLKHFGQSLRLGLSRDGITLLRLNRWRGGAVSVLAEQVLTHQDSATPERLAACLHQVFATTDCARLPVTIVLADDLVRLWLVTPPQGTKRLADIEAAAALRFQSLYGETLSDWTVMADWNARSAFFAAAIPRSLVDVLQQQAREHKFTLVEIAPQFIVTWNRWHSALKPGAWLAQVHDNLLTLGIVDAQNLCAVRSIPLSSETDFAWLQMHLTREAMLLNLPKPTQLQVCGAMAENWSKKDVLSGIKCSRLDQLRSGLAPQAPRSKGIDLAYTGASI
jgi:hypothetical protein